MEKENKPSAGRPKKPDSDSYQRATFIINKENLYKLKAIAYYERLNEKQAINTALETYFECIGMDRLQEALEMYARKK
ncbi:hypothetical protein GXP67_01940 [Rhodocytophaga rosea]|uniref:CopG family transcriptional regulator n=1 Tax=Rhodocytophaga rosea TaxID=2704465 RepID=A0A6C0GC42_9BACT|nr:hypothetical protein [Rhodocytophaga rosea]QHT65515.1 hypothetical protein GXP67_01940 [Rhodocytophaga rosea]